MIGKEEALQPIQNAEEKLPKLVFWSCLILLIFIFLLFLFQNFQDKKEYAFWNEKAVQENDASFCENIKNLGFSSRCYSSFVQQGYDCRAAEKPVSPCLLAQGVHLQDDLFCDAVFPEKVQENLECRVSVFIQRYTHEGLSDCCHIE